MSPTFPPKNREPQELGTLELYVEDATQSWPYDPNRLIYACVHGAFREDPADPAGTSVISSRPAFRYRSGDISILLAADELRRLIFTALSPLEYFTLRDRYGLFFEIHEDFYDPETGEAKQPKI